ncbi:hypothetical protein CO074_01235 [bacterium (Candidatus Moisslbacteria) CG_4_9_14_0_8_um_filter_36_20]|nr:MAG: hypothetical protein CO074_01235 [bacterium (Candidatus Moisslbacteria) CG_4_9_14_0_8_um_filter_36_20]
MDYCWTVVFPEEKNLRGDFRPQGGLSGATVLQPALESVLSLTRRSRPNNKKGVKPPLFSF